MEGFCRGCLKKFHDPIDLLQYCERNRRMFVYSTGLQVKRNDSFTFQLCKECHANMKLACKFKKQCRLSDKKFKNYLLFKGDDDIDFDIYIKTVEDPLNLRYPPDIGNSTPAHSKNKDDDNESTCTSIRNFMTDILDGEEMPPTEARIIREVIQEETDILDESLDSHWLRDDISVAESENEMDFSFSAFSTPSHSINSDHFITPKKLTDERIKEFNYYASKKINERPIETGQTRPSDMPILNDIEFENDANNHLTNEHIKPEDCINFNNTKQVGVQEKKYVCENNDINVNPNHVKSLKDNLFPNIEILRDENDSGFLGYQEKNMLSSSLLENVNDDEDEYCVNESQDKNQKNDSQLLIGIDTIKINIKNYTTINNEMAIDEQQHKLSLTQEFNKYNDKNNKEMDSNISASLEINDNVNNSNVSSELEEYISNVMLKAKNQQNNKLDDNDRTIEKNLEMALRNVDKQDFMLDQILSTPQGSLKSGASTPTIKNILFGNMTPNSGHDINEESYIDAQRDLIREKTENSDQQLIKLRDNQNWDYNNTTINELTNEDLYNVKCVTKTIKDEEEFDNHDTEMNAFTENKIGMTDVGDEIKSNNSTLGELDISFSKLLQGDSELDIKALEMDNLSICSDFLHEDVKDIKPDLDDGFKKPLPPMYDQYDLDAFLCKICNKTYKDQRALRIHFAKIHSFSIKGPRVRSTSRKINKICERCGQVFEYYATFNRHIKSCNDNNKQCKICMEDFETQVGLKIHMRMHKPEATVKREKEYLCITCGKTIYGCTNFQIHQRRHEKNYACYCSFCQAGFYRKLDLKLHISTHTQEKPFACIYCPRRFLRRIDYRKHMKRHEGKYRCDNCPIELTSKTHIRRHIRSKVCLKRSANENKT